MGIYIFCFGRYAVISDTKAVVQFYELEKYGLIECKKQIKENIKNLCEKLYLGKTTIKSPQINGESFCNNG